MPEASFGRSNRWLTALTVDPDRCGITATDLMDALAEQNIESRPVWKPMHLQPLYGGYDYYPHEESGSVSDRLFAEGICLPSGSNMTVGEQQLVIDLVKGCLNN